MAIECEERIIESVVWKDKGERDEYLEIKTDAGWTFANVKVRNCYHRDDETLAYLLAPSAITRWWGGFGRPVHQIEVLVKPHERGDRPELSDDTLTGQWHVVWDVTNDFQTISESKAAGDEYVAFIEREAEVIASRIDAGEDPATAHENMDSDHSGNTASWAWNVGIGKAKDEVAAERYRQWWNEKHAPDQDVEPGKLINPAVLHVG